MTSDEIELVVELRRRIQRAMFDILNGEEKIAYDEHACAYLADRVQSEIYQFGMEHPFPINTGLTAFEVRAMIDAGDELMALACAARDDAEMWCDGFDIKVHPPSAGDLASRTLHFYSVPINPRFMLPF